MLNSGVGMDIDGMFLRAMATSVDVCQNVTNKKTIITSVYNGIPETLLLNVIAWILLIALFTTLRHQAGDYGRLASQSLVNRSNKKRWTEVFYSGGAQIHKQPYAVNDDQPSSSNGTNNGLNIMETAPMSPIQYDSGIFAWIKVTWKLRKEQILLHTGPDAVHYLSFQQHLMFVMAIVTAVSSFVILPINFLAGPELGDYDINSFGRTTMSNLSPDSAWLWIHVIVTIAYVPLVVLVMRRASGRNAFKKAPTRTIMISNISIKERSETTIKNNMKTMFPHINIEDVKLAYNISKLYDRNVEYEKAREARFYCENHRDKNNLQVRPEYCSCRKEKAYDFYVREEQQLAGDVARLRAAALNEPLGTAFLTVPTVQEAQEIVNYVPPRNFPQWQFSFAPSPDDLFWENLNTSKSYWYVKWTVVNCMLFLVLFFLTTPAIVVNFVNNIPVIKDSERKVVSPLVSEFLPTLMLWTLSVLMPVIVAFSDKWMSHYTRSLQNYSIMTKCFGYLLFMILILPSLGLTSAQALLESLGKESVPWQCIFLPDRGSFYVNYIITTAFIGTALELLRFPELIVYIWMLLTARSRAETPHIRKSILIEFPFGTHYAWAVLVFTISIVYSVFCPLIMPFAMVYIGFKHFVDRHNLYFAYGPSNMISRNGGKIHSTAVTMTKFSVVILLLIMAMISTVRGAGMARTIILIVTLAVTLTLFTFMSPIKRCTAARRPSIVEIAGPSPIYEPAVLSTDPIRVNANVTSSTKAMPLSHVGSYGTDSVSDFDIRSQCSVTSVDA